MRKSTWDIHRWHRKWRSRHPIFVFQWEENLMHRKPEHYWCAFCPCQTSRASINPWSQNAMWWRRSSSPIPWKHKQLYLCQTLTARSKIRARFKKLSQSLLFLALPDPISISLGGNQFDSSFFSEHHLDLVFQANLFQTRLEQKTMRIYAAVYLLFFLNVHVNYPMLHRFSSFAHAWYLFATNSWVYFPIWSCNPKVRDQIFK